MVAIRSLEVENFRSFAKLRVDGLTQVSLVVGANNSGKTALLEAIEAIASDDSPFPLYRASFERGEFRKVGGAREDFVEIDVRHWFHGHRLEEGATFRLRSTGRRERSLSRSIQHVTDEDPSPPFVPGNFRLTLERPGIQAKLARLPITPDGFLGAGAPSMFMQHGLRLSPPVGFVTTDRLFPSELARLWTRVVLTPGEERAVEALRLIDPSVDRIAISGDGGSAVAQVLLHGATGPVPLGTLGEGISRLLTLALYLAVTPGGILLIDEIENGLHWSVLPQLWRFLVQIARALDVQVIATTHSKDCLEGLAALHHTDPALAAHVSVHRLEARCETPTRFDAARIAEYLKMDLEAR